jgi:hypothetical protein
VSPGYKERKKERKKKKNPWKHIYACPEGAKKMVGGQKHVLRAENTCWGVETGLVGARKPSWGSKHAAGAQNMLLGAQNMQLGLKICGWVVKMGS